jgi:hypothetical protein
MNLFQEDFDKRFRAAVQQSKPTTYRMRDADVIREIAEVWVDSGGDAGGFDEHYVAKVKAEIDRIIKWRQSA